MRNSISHDHRHIKLDLVQIARVRLIYPKFLTWILLQIGVNVV
jgi:hypothetical protein